MVWKTCKNPKCNKIFECFDKKGQGRRKTEYKRPFMCITCSPKCAREYANSRRKWNKYNRKKK